MYGIPIMKKQKINQAKIEQAFKILTKKLSKDEIAILCLALINFSKYTNKE